MSGSYVKKVITGVLVCSSYFSLYCQDLHYPNEMYVVDSSYDYEDLVYSLLG